MASIRGSAFTKAREAGITFGLELEVLVASKRGVIERLSIDQKRLELAKQLKTLAPNLPIAAKCSHDFMKRCSICKGAEPSMRFPGMRVFTPANPIYRWDENPEYLYFLVKNEYITCARNSEGFVDGHGVEISTPILDVNELEAGLPKATQIVSSLRKMDLKVAANTWCGLHIHVGIKSGMTLEIAKKAVTLMMLLEGPLLDEFCPLERRKNFHRPPINVDSNFARKEMRQDFLDSALTKDCPDLLKHFPFPLSKLKPGQWNNHDPRGLFEMMTLVWQAESLRRMWEGLSNFNEERNALALCLRDEKQKPEGDFDCRKRQNFHGTPSTLEFRYPQMDFDMTLIRNWTEIACKIVEIATYDSTAFRHKVVEIVETLEKSEVEKMAAWMPLLHDLGLGHQAVQWSEQLKYDEKGEPISLLEKDSFVML